MLALVGQGKGGGGQDSGKRGVSGFRKGWRGVRIQVRAGVREGGVCVCDNLM